MKLFGGPRSRQWYVTLLAVGGLMLMLLLAGVVGLLLNERVAQVAERAFFSRVTFDRRSKRSRLFVMGSDGANKRQITDTPRAFEYEADWQPVPVVAP